MEFPFDINLLLGGEISIIDRTLKPFNANPAYLSQRKTELCTVIDNIGRASARAQGLPNPITSASRLLESKHQLYLIKDDRGNSGYPAVVGLLKIGNKKLYVYDRHGVQHEVEPLCVLDFYVHESCQRRGYGRRLFEEMLMREGVKVRHIAIDRPSPKFLSFLEKHYDLKSPIPQVNNFVIFEGFFNDRQGPRDTKGRGNEPAKKPWAHLEPSHEYSPTHAQGVLQRDRLPPSRDVYGAVPRPNSRPSSGFHQNGLSAQHLMYSRYQATPPPIDLCQVASDGGSSPVDERNGQHFQISFSPPMLRRDGPSRDYLHLTNGNNNNAYISRRGGHLVSTTNQPSAYVSAQPGRVVPSSSVPVSLDSAWKVFGVPPRSLVSAVPGSTSAIVTNNRYRRTNLW